MFGNFSTLKMIPLRAVASARRMIPSAMPACTLRYSKKCPASITGKRRISVTLVNMMDPRRVVSYEDISKYTKQSDKLIIDVRDPDEVASTGKIPSSINIPLGHIEQALTSMSEEEFRQQYRRNKPQPSSEIVFYCRSGRRSSEALDKALSLGYSNSKTYIGSWEEWSSKK